MRKIITVLMVFCLLFSFAGCGRKGEYTCPSDNMFGLEKITISDKKIIVYFDKDKWDNGETGIRLGTFLGDNITGTQVYSSDTDYVNCRSNVKVEDGKYVVTVFLDDNIHVEKIVIFSHQIEITQKGIRISYSTGSDLPPDKR